MNPQTQTDEAKDTAQAGESGSAIEAVVAEPRRAIARARDAFIRLSPRLKRTGERVITQIREKPGLSAVLAGGAAVGLAAAIGAAEVAVGVAGAYAVYRLARGDHGDKGGATGDRPAASAEKPREKGQRATA